MKFLPSRQPTRDVSPRPSGYPDKAIRAFSCQVSARIRQCTRSILRRLFSKTVWAGPVTNGCRVGHEAHTLTPIMQLVTRRLQGEPQRCLRAEIEHELMGCARGGPGNSPSEAAFDHTMQMAAENPLDLRMTKNYLGKGRAAAEAVLIHLADPGYKGWLVHQQQSWAIGGCREHTINPKQPLLAQCATRCSRNQSIERHDAQRVIFDHIIQEPPTGQIAVRDKRLAHRLARVVISGDSQDWHVQRRYERAQMVVFFDFPTFNQIASDDSKVGERIQTIEC